MENTAFDNIATAVSYKGVKKACSSQLEIIRKTKVGELELLFREDYTLLDGRFANNGWLQEMPNPMTRLTWDNAAIMSIRTAEKYGLKEDILDRHDTGIPIGDTKRRIVEITFRNQKLKLPAYILPGLSDDTVLLNTGYGRTKVGRVGRGSGYNVYNLITGHDYAVGFDASLKETREKTELASVQEHWSMQGRDLVRVEDLHEGPHHPHGHGAHPSLWDEHQYNEGNQWGMTIDLNKCIGCGACVTACQAENNVPIVGRHQVALNREMHWLRTDRYFTGEDPDNPQVVHQVVACHHCEMAPCETVCPVTATVHSSDGLNDMAYNRCVGTRYCSNNCPPKVRRFNYFNFTNKYSETRKMVHNPDVTVRFRGVMEKCTFCLQRINGARIASKKKGVERVPDGAVVTACEQVCPTGAIVFGDVNNPESRVSKIKKDKRNYEMLPELNIRPRTSYLSKVTNCNPKLVKTGSRSKLSKHPEQPKHG